MDQRPESRATFAWARALALLFPLLGLLGISSCFLDPTCTDICVGDDIRLCQWDCKGGHGKIDLPDSCAPENQLLQCEEGARCYMVKHSDPSLPSIPQCLEKDAAPCNFGAATLCIGDNSRAQCRRTEEGDFAFAEEEPICTEPNQACHQNHKVAVCVDTPKVSCDPDAHPACDGNGISRCYGTRESGYALKHDECAEGQSCQGEIGEARCSSLP